MKIDYDVIIIGAGPAGSSAANRLMKNGIRTAIIEKKILPREKPCDGLVMDFIYKDIVRQFNPFPDNIFSNPPQIKGIKAIANNEEYSIRFSEPAQFVKRKDFDYWLAQESKAEIIDGMELVNLKDENTYPKVHCRDKKGKEYTFTARTIIGADGDTGATLKLIDPDFYLRKVKPFRFFMGKIHFEGSIDLDEHWWYSFINKQFGALNLVTQKDGTITIENCVRNGRDFKYVHENLYNQLMGTYGFKKRKTIRKDYVQRNQMAAMGLFHPGKNNILLAGETSGLLRLWGEGIGMGIDSGSAAARAILESLSGTKSALYYYKPLFKKLSKVSANEWNIIKLSWGRPGNIGDMDPKKGLKDSSMRERKKLFGPLFNQLKGFGTGRQSLIASVKSYL